MNIKKSLVLIVLSISLTFVPIVQAYASKVPNIATILSGKYNGQKVKVIKTVEGKGVIKVTVQVGGKITTTTINVISTSPTEAMYEIDEKNACAVFYVKIPRKAKPTRYHPPAVKHILGQSYDGYVGDGWQNYMQNRKSVFVLTLDRKRSRPILETSSISLDLSNFENAVAAENKDETDQLETEGEMAISSTIAILTLPESFGFTGIVAVLVAAGLGLNAATNAYNTYTEHQTVKYYYNRIEAGI